MKTKVTLESIIKMSLEVRLFFHSESNFFIVAAL